MAITLPDTVRQFLIVRQTELSGVRWTSPDSLHLTLRFIGEVPRAMVSAIKAGLRAVSGNAFSLQVKGLGYFDNPPTSGCLGGGWRVGTSIGSEKTGGRCAGSPCGTQSA